MSLLADIFITVKPTLARMALTKRSIRSLIESTDPGDYRLTVCIDGEIPGIPAGSSGELSSAHKYLTGMIQYDADFVLMSAENHGLGPTINRAIAHIKTINDWYAGPSGDVQKVAPLIVMCQDDIEYEPGWLPKMARMHMAYGASGGKSGFSTGHEAVEHAGTRRGPKLPDGMFYQDWIRATHMMAYAHYWESLMPIPAFDPETGRLRGKPNDGIGSSVDWWLIRNHPNSVVKSGRTNLVIPGLVRHIGYEQSTWLDRPLPESDADITKMKEDA